METQTIFVLVIVLLASVYVLRRAARSLRAFRRRNIAANDSSCASACGKCGGEASGQARREASETFVARGGVRSGKL